MGSAERRQRHRQELRARILDATLDIVSEQGLGALSIRAIADRIEYSSATIYLHFASKEELLREVAAEGFRRFDACLHAAVEALPPGCEPLEELRILGHAYVRFALDNTAYFRVMFDLPADAHVTVVQARRIERQDPSLRDDNWERVTRAVCRLRNIPAAEAEQVTVAAWGMLHGLVTLYLSGQLQNVAPDQPSFDALLAACMAIFRQSFPAPAATLRPAS